MEPLFGFYMHVLIVVKKGCGCLRGEIKNLYLSIKFDYVFIEVSIFKVLMLINRKV